MDQKRYDEINANGLVDDLTDEEYREWDDFWRTTPEGIAETARRKAVVERALRAGAEAEEVNARNHRLWAALKRDDLLDEDEPFGDFDPADYPEFTWDPDAAEWLEVE